MTRNERDLLLILAREFYDPPADDPSHAANSARLRDVTKRLAEAIKKDAQEIEPGDAVTVKVIVSRVEGGFVFFKSDDGAEAYRRVGDIVR